MFVDTNILLYAADVSVPEHTKSNKLLESLRKGSRPWALSWNVIYEFLRVSTHGRVKPKPWNAQQAHRFVEALLASSSLQLLEHTDRHATLLSQAIGEVPLIAANKIFDLHTAVLMREHGVRTIFTNDMDFHRFPWVEVENPLA